MIQTNSQSFKVYSILITGEAKEWLSYIREFRIPCLPIYMLTGGYSVICFKLTI